LPTDFASKLTIPRVLWLYDFQHLHHPENFTNEARQRMDRLFRENAASATRILAYSHAVLADIQTFLPAQSHKAHRIRFVPSIPDSTWTSDPSTILAQYRLPGLYFYVPNQLYPYKNHMLLVAALSHLKKRNINATVVCSGTTVPGKQAVLDELLAEAEKLNVAKQLIMLGSVPRESVFALMRQSLCVINPSLFEGFSLSVAEAHFLGQRVLLSDLPVMHEHQVINACYFDPRNSEDLSAKMEFIWNSPKIPTPGNASEEAGGAVPYQQALQVFAHELIKLFSI
jgi:glycosyltransferase involved in cell wall biosynthesis